MSDIRLSPEGLGQLNKIAEERSATEAALAEAQTERNNALSAFILFLDENVGVALPLKCDTVLYKSISKGGRWERAFAEGPLLPGEYVTKPPITIGMHNSIGTWGVQVTPPNMQEFQWLGVHVADLQIATVEEVLAVREEQEGTLSIVGAQSGLSDAIARIREAHVPSDTPI